MLIKDLVYKYGPLMRCTSSKEVLKWGSQKFRKIAGVFYGWSFSPAYVLSPSDVPFTNHIGLKLFLNVHFHALFFTNNYKNFHIIVAAWVFIIFSRKLKCIIITRHEWLRRAAGKSHAANCGNILYICRILGHLS